jgi:hypothetical protein
MRRNRPPPRLPARVSITAFVHANFIAITAHTCCRIDVAEQHMSLVNRSRVCINMRISKEALSTRVVVRRARRGAAPFVWEINKDTMSEPVYVSPEAFVTMEAAFVAGQSRLAEFTPPQLPTPSLIESHF